MCPYILFNNSLISAAYRLLKGCADNTTPENAHLCSCIGKASHKAAIALMRSYAYLQGQQWAQALSDAKVAAVFSARMPGCIQSWPRAMAAISSAIEGKQVWRLPFSKAEHLQILNRFSALVDKHHNIGEILVRALPPLQSILLFGEGRNCYKAVMMTQKQK